MSIKSERREAREDVTTYDEAELSGLLAHVGEAIDKFRAGELDAIASTSVFASLGGALA
ncbi:hypothetical protein [uncultured Serinicoccus sp.]|uniref:hypothetical protein n=1 Tax=uncultured Serinicoccus sp. TaxID=735514 RepID=UPI002607CFB7|nr:hypothetical protein [uncultured Serinicoccus sp.]